jgi:hypothetical protein
VADHSSDAGEVRRERPAKFAIAAGVAVTKRSVGEFTNRVARSACPLRTREGSEVGVAGKEVESRSTAGSTRCLTRRRAG